jgi:ribosomal protein S18 acetylase RimI-like enzyme
MTACRNIGNNLALQLTPGTCGVSLSRSCLEQPTDEQGSLPKFRPAVFQDIPELVRLEHLLFHTDQCSCRSFRYLIQKATVIVACSTISESLIGYTTLLSRKNSKKLRIYSLGIAPEDQKSGFGTYFLRHIEGIAFANDKNCITLEVGDNNLAALNLYKKCGFQQYGFRYSYYEDGGHALLLRKHLLLNDKACHNGFGFPASTVLTSPCPNCRQL